MYQRPRGDGESKPLDEEFGNDADRSSDESSDDAISDQLASEGLSDVPSLQMFQPSDDSKSISKNSGTESGNKTQTFALADQQNELGTASLVDVRTPKPPSEDSTSKSESLKKKLDPFGLFTLSKKEE